LADPPERSIGQHCSTPHDCPFQNTCWHHVPVESIFTIPYLTWAKKHTLIQQGVFAIADLPSDFQLTENQQAYVDAVGSMSGLHIEPKTFRIQVLTLRVI